MTLLVVAAIRIEAEASLAVLKKMGQSAEFFELGIGPIHAAKSEARLMEVSRGRDVLYLGSCGSFYPFAEPHLVTVDKVFWMPPCMRTGIAEGPEHLHAPFSLPESDLSLPRKSVLTTPSISLVDDFAPGIALKLPERETLVENMELYACAEALLQARSLRVILGVSNQVGPEGHNQWLSNFRDVAIMTADFLFSRQI